MLGFSFESHPALTARTVEWRRGKTSTMGKCSICSAPQAIQNIVNQKLADRVKIATIALQSGFSKSAIGRHKLNCFSKAELNTFRTRSKGSFKGKRFVTSWGDGAGELAGALTTHVNGELVTLRNASDLKPDDVILRVVYDGLPDIRLVGNPAALVSEISAAHEEAIAENYLREMAKQDTPPEEPA